MSTYENEGIAIDYLSDCLEKVKYNSTEPLRIDQLNIVNIIVKLMIITENFYELNGLEKKMLVMHALKRLIIDSNVDDTSKEYQNRLVDTTCQHIIDAILLARKGKILKRNKKELFGFIKRCFF
jgi:hypothetical protein